MLTAGCGGTESADSSKPETPKESETFTVVGSLTLDNARGVNYLEYGRAGESCWGEQGYDDIRAGASVVVRNSKGEKVGLGQLDEGSLTEDSSEYVPGPCRFPFSVTDVPVDGNLYSVEVSGRGEIDFDRLSAGAVSLNLG